MSDFETFARFRGAPRALAALAVAALIAGMGMQSLTEAPRASADGTGAGTQLTSPAGLGRSTGQTRLSNPGTVGQCTWGAAQKWFEASGSYPAMRGDAKDWRGSASAAGWTVVDEPQARSIVVFQPGVAGANGYGHVAWVDSVSPRADGQWIHVTEMNNTSLGGVGIYNGRDVKVGPGMSYILLP